MLFGLGKMLIALRRCCFARNRRRSRWNDDSGLWMTFGNSIVDGLTIICAVRGQRRNVGVDLVKQIRYFGNVTDIIRRQLDRHDFMRDGINSKVQLTLPPARPDAVFLIEPFALAVNLEASAVDQEMQWLRAIDALRQDRQAAAAPA